MATIPKVGNTSPPPEALVVETESTIAVVQDSAVRKTEPTIDDIQDITAIRTEDYIKLHIPTETQPSWDWLQERIGEKEIPFATKELTVLNPSCFRRISDLFWTVVHDMWRSAGGLLGAILPGCLKFRISAECATKLEDPSLQGIKGNEVYPALCRLNTQRESSSAVLHEYCKYLEEIYPTAQYIPNFVQKNATSIMPDARKPGRDKLLIPIVLKGFPCDHVVALCISYDEDGDANIEFYDPKGLTIADRFDQRLAYRPDMTLGKLIATLTSHYCADLRAGSKIHVKENIKKQQWDSHNCGIYVSHFFECRLRGVVPEMLYGLKYSYRNTATMRQEMIDNLLPRLLEQAKVNKKKESTDITYPEEGSLLD